MKRNDEIIVIRRPDEAVEAKKGGVWKIAHADFMTAMMAFFLIMWLVNATDEEIKKSIANYFNPMNLMAQPTSARGLADPTDDAVPPASGEENGKTSGETPMGSDTPGDQGSALGGGNVEEGNDRTMASAGILEETDNAAFNDPYAELASSASDLDPDDPTSVDQAQTTLGTTGTTTQSEETRDPFDPAYWQTVQSRPAQTLRPGRQSGDELPPNAVIDATAPAPVGDLDADAQSPSSLSQQAPTDAAQGNRTRAAPSQGTNVPDSIRNAAGPRSALAEQILMEAAAQEARTDAPSQQGAEEEPSATQTAREELAQALEGANAEVSLGAGESVITISLTDDNIFSMFAIGSADPTTSARDLFARVGNVLAERDGRIIIRGHTDARPFRSGTSDNWMLSFQRAHATKNALVNNGVAERRFARVEGLADREPTRPDDPLADENRRIEILYEPAEPIE